MFLYIKQKNMKFVYRRSIYETPIEIMFDREYVSTIVNQLYKQNIDDYIITAVNDKKLKSFIEAENKKNKIYKNLNTIQITKIKENENDEIKNILNELSKDSKKLNSKLDDILTKPVYANNVITKSPAISPNNKKSKDDENTFIPQIDTEGMNIKTNIKTEKSITDASSSADVLRELLKGL